MTLITRPSNLISMSSTVFQIVPLLTALDLCGILVLVHPPVRTLENIRELGVPALGPEDCDAGCDIRSLMVPSVGLRDVPENGYEEFPLLVILVSQDYDELVTSDPENGAVLERVAYQLTRGLYLLIS